MLKPLLLSCLAASALVGCGTLTGIPSHGGGKRFAVEQELVSASARASVKDMDLSALQGKKVALYISTIGDQGSGNIAGGRYSLDALIRGEYLNTPNSVTDYAYPNYTTTASTNAGTINSTTTSQSVLNAPSQSINQTGASMVKGVSASPRKAWVNFATKRSSPIQEMCRFCTISSKPCSFCVV